MFRLCAFECFGWGGHVSVGVWKFSRGDGRFRFFFFKEIDFWERRIGKDGKGFVIFFFFFWYDLVRFENDASLEIFLIVRYD